MDWAGIELTTPRSADRPVSAVRHVTETASGLLIIIIIIKTIGIITIGIIIIGILIIGIIIIITSKFDNE